MKTTTVLAACLAAWLPAVWTSATAASALSSKKPVKVFILAGQSNMQGHAHVRTFDAMELDPVTAEILKEMRRPDGTPTVCEKVWISSLGTADVEQVGRLTAGFGAKGDGPKIGPEFTLGIYLQKFLNEPIVLIKTAWGGKSLHTDFRPPSAGPFQFHEIQLEQFKKQGKDLAQIQAEKVKATGQAYRMMMDHVKKVLANLKRVYPDYDPQQGYELAGFVWFQGWNDMVDSSVYPHRDKPGGYDLYSQLLAHFIRDVRQELNAPRLPFVIGVLGVGGPVEKYSPDQQRYQATHQNFRLAMAAPAHLPEFRGNVTNVFTEKYWDMELTALKTRENQIKPKMNEINQQVQSGALTREAGRMAVEKLYAETFTPRELRLLRESTSNFEFHYYGSARIMAQIGKAFAEAMAGMLR